jgi:Sigma-70, region 4
MIYFRILSLKHGLI